MDFMEDHIWRISYGDYENTENIDRQEWVHDNPEYLAILGGTTFGEVVSDVVLARRLSPGKLI
jgi:hypothetical protein